MVNDFIRRRRVKSFRIPIYLYCMSIKSTKIILDTDPGADDIFALLWLLSLSLQSDLKSNIEIAAITTVGGNVPELSTFQAAHKILNLLGIQGIEVGRAAPRLRGEISDAAHIHGQDGMGNLSMCANSE